MGDASDDPFEDFRRSMAIGTVRDPYPRLAELRRQGAVHKIPFRQITGELPPSPATLDDTYSVLSHEAVTRVLLDGETFTSTRYARTLGQAFGRTILEMDEPEHGRYRNLLREAFSKSALDRWEHALMKPIVNRLIDRFAAGGRADLVRELTFPFPAAVIAGMIGVDERDQADFHRMAVELVSIAVDRVRAMRASHGLGELFARVLSERRKAPRDDLTSVLATAELDGTRLDDEAIYSFLRLLAPTGAETTYHSLGNLLYGLLRHPEQHDAVRADRALIPQAIEEGLRWEPPVLWISRIATREVDLDGIVLPAGATLNVSLGAANRDDTRYSNPDAFDIFRSPKTHMAFATGAHRCLGLHLARMESTVALNALFDRLPNLRLDPVVEDIHISGLKFRSLLSLPVLFDPA